MVNSKMFVYYSKTKAEFISENLPDTYNNHIVFIKGDANGNGSCIYTHGVYFANFAELLAAINYVKGVKVGTDTYNAAAGGGYVTFETVDPSTLTLDVSNGKLQFGLTTDFVNKVNNTTTNLGTKDDIADKDGSAFARIANLAALVSDITGGSTDSIEGQINSAISALRAEIVGTLDPNDAETLQAINDELDGLDVKIKNIEDAGYITIADVNSALTSKANLENGKIVASELPDYILGQVMFGGTIITELNGTYFGIRPSANFASKYGEVNSIPAADVAKYEGVYFIAQIDGLFTPPGASPIDYLIGDWIISTGSAWAKIDNTDAVTAVAGLNGYITADELADELSAEDLPNGLATKSEALAAADAVEVTASGDNTLITASVSNKRSVSIAPTKKLTDAVAMAESAYQKPSTGIAKTDLDSAVQASLDKADAAAPQSTTYTKAEVDAMWEWEEL